MVIIDLIAEPTDNIAAAERHTIGSASAAGNVAADPSKARTRS
jgi:hypothetical protein